MDNRQGFNLFTKIGRENFFEGGLLGYEWARQFVLQDTFGKFICAIFGHSRKTFLTDDYPPEKVCFRCYKRIKD
jgi:hypothetical protein